VTAPDGAPRVDAYDAVVIGATGAVGGALARALLHSPACRRVVALSRRPFTALDAAPGRSKLELHVVDYADLEAQAAAHARGCAVAFCAVGIGQPRKVSAEEFRRVDVEYAGAFARGAVAAGARHVSLLSAVGANAASRNRYIRTKGDAEQAVIAAGARRTSLFRPSLLVTREIRYGVQDRLTQALFPLLAPVLPRRLHQITVEDLGRTMQLNAESGSGSGVEYLYYPDYVALLRRGPAAAGSGRPS